MLTELIYKVAEWTTRILTFPYEPACMYWKNSIKLITTSDKVENVCKGMICLPNMIGFRLTTYINSVVYQNCHIVLLKLYSITYSISILFNFPLLFTNLFLWQNVIKDPWHLYLYQL